MYGDPLFPLPEPDWILVFDVVLHRVSILADDTDEGGYPVTTGAPQLPIKAYVASPDTRKLERGGEAADVVVLVSNAVTVTHRDQIEIPASLPLPAQLRGRFRVDTVRPNPSHTRVLCNRVTDPEGSLR